MARRGDDSEGFYDHVRRLRRGWQLWVGDGWAEVQSTAVRDDSVVVTVTDGRVFRVNYLEAVLCRKPAPGRLIPQSASLPSPHSRKAESVRFLCRHLVGRRRWCRACCGS